MYKKEQQREYAFKTTNHAWCDTYIKSVVITPDDQSQTRDTQARTNYYVVYRFWDPNFERYLENAYEIGKDVSLEIARAIDDLNYEEEQNNKRQARMLDPRFTAAQTWTEENTASDLTDLIETIPQPGCDPAEILFREKPIESEDIKKVRKVVETEFTASQKELYFAHFGENRQIESIRQDEYKRTGELKTHQAFSNRVNKIVRKTALHAFGVEPVKRRKNNSDN